VGGGGHDHDGGAGGSLNVGEHLAATHAKSNSTTVNLLSVYPDKETTMKRSNSGMRFVQAAVLHYVPAAAAAALAAGAAPALAAAARHSPSESGGDATEEVRR
jgi:hypothetical protein